MCRDVPTHEPKYTEFDLRPGGRYVIEIPVPQEGFTYRGYGVFREVKPPERLVFSWAWQKVKAGESQPEELQDAASVVTVELIDRGKSTDMVFTHEGFSGATMRDEHQKGWDGCFEKLEAYLRT
ncbi:MAG: SRPBCC family protein [Candidatus Acidiferrales bacterium]